jgi:hypothetical protein
MEHKTENTIESADLIREIYELTHQVSIENNPDIELQLEELCKLAELRGVL